MLARKHSENRESSDEEIHELFLPLLEIIPPCFLTVDAIDECLDKPALYRLLSRIPKQFKVLITSRNLPDLRKHLHRTYKASHIELEVLPEMTESDIELYISSQLKHATIQYCPEIVSRIKQKLKDSNGIFLWICLMFQYIEDQTCNEEIIECLDQLPLTLTARYDRILQDINALAKTKPQERLLAHKIFFWISVARRPLTIKEVCGLLAVKPASDRENGFMEWRIPNDPYATIISVCGSLLVARGANRVLYPIHFTASEYLKQYMKSDERLAEITTYYEAQQLQSSDSLAAAVCMRYLSLTFVESLHERVIRSAADALKMLDSDGPRMGMLRYATIQWFNHLKSVPSPEPLLLDIADEFLDDSRKSLKVFWNLYLSSNHASTEDVRLPTIAATRHQIVAHFELRRVLKRRTLSENPAAIALGIILSLVSVVVVSLNIQSRIQLPW